MIVRAVSAYVPLQKRTQHRFHMLMGQLVKACDNYITLRWNFPYNECWLVKEQPPWVAANPRATDRFATHDEHMESNIIQHSVTQWVMNAATSLPNVDVWVWFGASLMKQGDWRGNPIHAHHIREFLAKVKAHGPFDTIPFPGIEPQKPIEDHGNNWRFCGSTLIFPKKCLRAIDQSYKFECRKFIKRVGAVPLDLAIWPAVEKNSGLPFRFYQAEYDASQLTGFPG